MKKNNLLALSLLTTFALSVSTANAASWSNQGTKDERKNARQELKEDVATTRSTILEEKEKLREELKAGSTEVMDKIGELHAARLEKRFTFYFNRQKSILDRINTRLTTLEGQLGVDKLKKARTLYNQAAAKLAEAKTKGAAAISSFSSIDGNDLPSQRKEVFAAREEAKAALALFKENVRLMKDVVKEMRLVSEKAKPSLKPSSSPKGSPKGSPKASFTPRGKKFTSPVPVVPPPVN